MKFSKIRYNVSAAAAMTAMAFAGCSDDTFRREIPQGDTSLPITLTAAYPTLTRASDAGFEDGDRMGVFVLDYEGDAPQSLSGNGLRAANVRFDFNGTDNTWKGVTDIYWKDKTTPADIIGYYPFQSEIETPEELPVSISRRQDQERSDYKLGGYEASDFLWAKAEKALPQSSSVGLTFRHLFAGIKISLQKGDGFTSEEWSGLEKNVLVSNVVATGTVNISDGSVKVGESSPISVIPLEWNGDYRAVVIPQTIKGGETVVALSVGTESYNLVKKEPTTLATGKMHTFTITVNKNPDGKIEFCLASEAITQWLDDVDFRDGIMRQYTVIEVPEKGTLADVVAAMNLDPSKIYNLKLKGELNDTDFKYIRENITLLKAVNLYECKVFCEACNFGDDLTADNGWKEYEDAIGEKAFFEMKTLSHVIFPKKLRIIGPWAFTRTGLLGDLVIPEGVEYIGWIFMPSDNSHVNPGVFGECNFTGTLTLPSTLKHIEGSAFLNTKFSGNLSLPERILHIGPSCFRNTSFTGELILPESLKNIGDGSFAGISFNGSLVIPQGFKTIPHSAFEGCKFNGTLRMSEGIEQIGNHAFEGCNFKGELSLPSTIYKIGAYAFSNTNFSSIKFPDEISYIEQGAFSNCNRLSGSIDLPKKINAISISIFANCPLLEEVIIPKGVLKIGGLAFENCYNLSSVICNSEEPPLCVNYNNPYAPQEYKTPFEGVPKDNFTLQVPEKSIDAYKRAGGWRDFKRIAAYSNFVCRPAKACALNSKHQESVILNADGEWEASHVPSWVSLSKTSGKGKTEIMLTINEMGKGSGDREDFVEFSLKGTEFTTRCEISQRDYQYGEDECITLQKASRGNGIDVLFIGDCFDAEAIASGKYLDLVNRQMDAFFGVEPYTTYRDYFNVYACFPLSQESGINTANTWYNTRFSTYYACDAGCSTPSLNCFDPDIVFDYAVAHSPLTREKMPQSLIIMALNNDEYGSASVLTGSGAAIAICCDSSDPYPMDTRGVLQHEACGHAFGKLGEERVSENRYLSNSDIDRINGAHWSGWWRNLSLSGKLSDVEWSHLIFDPRYSDKVDIFEGGFGKARGCFRSEINSCMNYGIPYFNAISRQTIVERILDYSGEGFSMEKFYANDKDTWGATNSTRAIGDFADTPSSIHNPVKIVKSKKY